MASGQPTNRLPFLESLARSSRPEDQLVWLRIATDCLVEANPDVATNSDCFVQTFSKCLQSADEDARFAVARRLVPRADVPASILGALAKHGDDAGVLTLTRARNLSRADLKLALRDPMKARAVARRDDLDEDLVADILSCGDLEALTNLAGNSSARLTAPQFLALARRAREAIENSKDRRLADHLLTSAPMRAEYAVLFMEANSLQRNAILLATQRAELGLPSVAPSVSAPRSAIQRLERHALDDETELFLKTLAEILGCTPAMASKIAADRSGEPLAVALAAMGAPNDVSVRILTSSDLHDGRDYRRVGALARLRDALSPTAARRVISAIVGQDWLRDRSESVKLLGANAPREVAPSSIDRRMRPNAAIAPPEENLSPAAVRRRRAFAFRATQLKPRV